MSLSCCKGTHLKFPFMLPYWLFVTQPLYKISREQSKPCSVTIIKQINKTVQKARVIKFVLGKIPRCTSTTPETNIVCIQKIDSNLLLHCGYTFVILPPEVMFAVLWAARDIFKINSWKSWGVLAQPKSGHLLWNRTLRWMRDDLDKYKCYCIRQGPSSWSVGGGWLRSRVGWKLPRLGGLPPEESDWSWFGPEPCTGTMTNWLPASTWV